MVSRRLGRRLWQSACVPNPLWR